MSKRLPQAPAPSGWSGIAAQAVLLSGGMDSVAALHWALENGRVVRAIGFDYGQPNRDHEITAAGRICADLGVPYTRVALADALGAGRAALHTAPDHDPGTIGQHPAFVPGRNAVFLAVAAAYAGSWWPRTPLNLVVGANRDDAAGFHDCRAPFLVDMGGALRHALDCSVQVVAPFLDRSKAQIAAPASPAARADIARSWSCYRREGPCGACSPCVLRAAAFAAAGIVDACAPATLTGGDPHREAR